MADLPLESNIKGTMSDSLYCTNYVMLYNLYLFYHCDYPNVFFLFSKVDIHEQTKVKNIEKMAVH